MTLSPKKTTLVYIVRVTRAAGTISAMAKNCPIGL